MICSLSNRKSYECLKKFTYFNQASLGLISASSTKKMTDFLNKIARFGNIYISDEDELYLVNKLRKNASILLGGQTKQTAVLSSASEMLSQIPYILKPSQKSKILLIETDFPAVTRPWLQYCKNNNCSVKFIKENPDEDLTYKVISKISTDTSIIALSLIQYSTGTKLDVEMISKIAKSKGIKLVIDITQALGAVPIFADKWNADFLVSSGYKWLGGHGGVSLAYLNKDILNINPLNAGWMGAPNPFKMQSGKCAYFRNAKSYTQSTMSYVSIVGLEKSIQEIIKLNPLKIENHSKKLSKYFMKKIDKNKWQIYHNKKSINKSFHIIAFKPNSKDLEPIKVFKKLKKKNIICSLRDNKLRLSIAHFNNQEDINHLLEILN